MAAQLHSSMCMREEFHKPTDVNVRHLGGSRFSAVARGHQIVSDQPFENGGEDAGMTPPELLLASLGTCAGYYAVQYLNARGLPADRLKLNVAAEKGSQPARFSSFHVTVSVGPLDQRHIEGLLRAVKACMVHHTLQNQPHVSFSVSSEHLGDEAAVLSNVAQPGSGRSGA